MLFKIGSGINTLEFDKKLVFKIIYLNGNAFLRMYVYMDKIV